MEKVTAIHEAAHVVAAYLSEFHFLVNKISLQSDEVGETFVSLSRRKVANSRITVEGNPMDNPDVVVDAATIFYAGFEAEKKHCLENGISIEKEFSNNDYQIAEDFVANCPSSIRATSETLIEFAKSVVDANWDQIDGLSDLILAAPDKSLDSVDAIDFLDQKYGRNSWA